MLLLCGTLAAFGSNSPRFRGEFLYPYLLWLLFSRDYSDPTRCFALSLFLYDLFLKSVVAAEVFFFIFVPLLFLVFFCACGQHTYEWASHLF